MSHLSARILIGFLCGQIGAAHGWSLGASGLLLIGPYITLMVIERTVSA